MRKLVYSHLISANGYVETNASYTGPNWAVSDEELSNHFSEIEQDFDCHFYGRKVYQAVSEWWPTADNHPDTPPKMAEYSQIWRNKKKYVFSTSLAQANWNTEIISQDSTSKVQQLKNDNGQDILLYGSNLATSFFRDNLIDEIRLYVNPVLIGNGVGMLEPNVDVARLTLIGTRVFQCGVVLLHYSVLTISGAI